MRIAYAADRRYVPASHEDPRSPGAWKKVLFQKGELVSGSVPMVNWARLPPGKGFAAHYHEDMQEVFILVQGEAAMTVAGRLVRLGPGDALAVDPREVHQMRNCGSGEVEYVVFGIATGQGGRTVVAAESPG
ncbi:MAG: cupin domain-containing protein [Thermoguttaceae bacterium]|jgi:mannose-6-phosphate isomerase-like protein (cupin superfamily)